MPNTPSAASSAKVSRGNAWASSIAAARGAMHASLKRAKFALMACCAWVRSKSIDTPRRCCRNDAVPHLLAQPPLVPLGRVAIAPAATSRLLVDRSLGHTDDQVLVLRCHLGSIRIGEPDEVERARTAAEQTEGGLEISIAEGDQLGVVRADRKDRLDAETTAPLARAGRIHEVLVLQQQMRRLLLEHLVVLVEDAAGCVNHADMVVPIGPAHGTRAALQPHETDVDILFALVRVDAGGQRAQQIVPAGGDAVGHHLG